MLAMAVRAVGDIRFLMKVILPVITLPIILGYPRMAARAVDPARGLAGPGKAGVHIGVAFYAGDVLVGRFLQFGLVHVQGDFFPLDQFVKVFLAMALHADAVRYADGDSFPADLMRSMAVCTGGDGSRLLLP